MKIIILLLTLFIDGCSFFPKPAAVHDLGLSLVNPSFNENRRQPTIINVEAPKWLYDNRIRYRLLYSSPTHVRFYSLDRWLAPPPELFEQLLNTSGLILTHPLTIRLLTFEQQFTTLGQANVVMTFTANLTSANKNANSRINEFTLHLPCPSPDANGAVTGFSSLTKEAVKKLQDWLVKQPY